jgi:IS30 family transposase
MSIQALLQAQLSGPVIARKLRFNRSAISREINRSEARPSALAADYQAGRTGAGGGCLERVARDRLLRDLGHAAQHAAH